VLVGMVPGRGKSRDPCRMVDDDYRDDDEKSLRLQPLAEISSLQSSLRARRTSMPARCSMP
jgi:hypothetical protein